MTDLRMKTISIACALALVTGCMPAVAFAQEESATASPSPKQQANSLCDEAASSTPAASEDALSPASTRIPIDRQAFVQAEDEGITLQSVNLNATVAPHDAFSDEFMYFSEFESGKNYDLTLSAGDNYHAMGCYQFDNRYGLQDFLIACYNYSPEHYSMLAWLKDADFDLRYEQNADGSYTTPIRIFRIHMEEDAAKMVHVGGEEGRIGGAAESLIDYNRCGTPLIELVTEPDLRTPEEARLFMEKLRRIFVTLGISDCSMEKGSMRCDGNVSLRRRGETKLGTKTELKNLNSFKSLHDGLAYEICRQAEVLEEGGIIYQETRHWEPSRKRTVVMRVKETADDYRLFPDPDLAPFDLDDEFIDRCRGEIPELPDAKRARFEADFGIKAADAEQIAGDPEFAEFFEAAAAGMAGKEAQTVANLLVNEMIAYLKGAGVSLAESGIAPAQVAALAKLLATDAISSNQAHEVFEAMAQTGDDPNKIVDERGMRQVSDAGALQPIVDEVLANCAEQAQQYRDGNQKVIGFLVGQCMKASRGKGNPKLFNELLRTSLS